MIMDSESYLQRQASELMRLVSNSDWNPLIRPTTPETNA
jgi:hypothetical protein